MSSSKTIPRANLKQPTESITELHFRLPINAWDALRRNAEAHARLQQAAEILPSHTRQIARAA